MSPCQPPLEMIVSVARRQTILVDLILSRLVRGLRRIKGSVSLSLVILAVASFNCLAAEGIPAKLGTKNSIVNDKRDQPTPSASRLHHILIVSSEPENLKEAYEDDGRLVLGGGRINGEVLVRVNGSPIFLQLGGSRIFGIDAFLEDGENSITIEGRHATPMFAKVIRTNDVARFFTSYHHEKVVTKALLPTDKSNVTLQFKAEVPEDELPDLLIEPGKPSDNIEHQIQTRMNQLLQALRARSSERFQSLVSPRIQPTPWWLTGSEDADCRLPESLEEAIKDRRYGVQTEPSDFRLVVGRRSVLAYSHKTFSSTPTFRLVRDDASLTTDIDKIIWVRVDGTWLSY